MLPLAWDAPVLSVQALGSDAEQLIVEPPLAPAQDQVHGLPVPVTVVEVPVEHRLVLGFVVVSAALLVPHAPLTGAALQTGLPVLTVALTGLPCFVSVPLVQSETWVTVVLVGTVPP